jgi:hypothetical protein
MSGWPEEQMAARRTSPAFERPTGVEPGDTSIGQASNLFVNCTAGDKILDNTEEWAEIGFAAQGRIEELECQLARVRSRVEQVTADRDRWAERNRVLEAKLAAIREVVR